MPRSCPRSARRSHGQWERLWLAEPYALVYRLWRKRRGKRSYWAVDEEFALDAADRISKDVAETVLARLHRAGQSREYALVPAYWAASVRQLHNPTRAGQ
ncbi:hypothetical protein [Streptomyces sp. 2A115]|uniref:hypothetical protein n=1 Tax=Streptomyces sp. 2A115 TaxID=3457439 RepID=UPI003FCFC3BD